MSTLAGYQRKHLRGLAHAFKPVVQVGRGGLTDALVAEVARALQDHELIKVALTKPPDKKALAAELAARSDAHLCGLIGHTVVLYRRREEKPSIVVPTRPEAAG